MSLFKVKFQSAAGGFRLILGRLNGSAFLWMGSWMITSDGWWTVIEWTSGWIDGATFVEGMEKSANAYSSLLLSVCFSVIFVLTVGLYLTTFTAYFVLWALWGYLNGCVLNAMIVYVNVCLTALLLLLSFVHPRSKFLSALNFMDSCPFSPRIIPDRDSSS